MTKLALASVACAPRSLFSPVTPAEYNPLWVVLGVGALLLAAAADLAQQGLKLSRKALVVL